jgi:hypothetical protein
MNRTVRQTETLLHISRLYNGTIEEMRELTKICQERVLLLAPELDTSQM